MNHPSIEAPQTEVVPPALAVSRSRGLQEGQALQPAPSQVRAVRDRDGAAGSSSTLHPGALSTGVLMALQRVPGGLLGPAAGCAFQCSSCTICQRWCVWEHGPCENHINDFCDRAVPWAVAAPVPSADTAFSWPGLTLPGAKCHWFVSGPWRWGCWE